MNFPKSMLARVIELLGKSAAFWLNTKKASYCRVLSFSQKGILVRGELVKGQDGKYKYDDFLILSIGDLKEESFFGYNRSEDYFYPAK